MSSVLIVEDEKPAADWLKQLIFRMDPQISLLATIDSVRGAVEWFRANPVPDLVFMDIQLADGLSFEIFGQVQVVCPVIFTTVSPFYKVFFTFLVLQQFIIFS